jgi:hypothetical protein
VFRLALSQAGSLKGGAVMATAGRKKYVVINGPSLLEGIYVEGWVAEHLGHYKVPTFTLDGGRKFIARVHAIVNPPASMTTGFSTILLGEFIDPDEKIEDCQFFVMYYTHRGPRGGILEPLESLESDNPILSYYFPQLFKEPKPAPENPALAYLREMPWKKKMELAQNFVTDLLDKRGDLAMTRKFVLDLFSRASQPGLGAIVEIDGPYNLSLRPLLEAFCEICPPINDFLRELDASCFLACGAVMGDIDCKCIKLALGPNAQLEVE